MSSVVVVSSENVDEKQQSLTTSVVQAADKKVNLLGMSRAELEKFFEDLGEKKFRASQVMKWIHQFFVTDFAEMSNISGKLREKLEKFVKSKHLKWCTVTILKMVPVNGCFV
jgi:23S rRNA (adenine2503-C2)-methyltransferase